MPTDETFLTRMSAPPSPGERGKYMLQVQSAWGDLHVEAGQRLQTVNESSRPRRRKTRWTQKTWPRRWFETLALMPERSPDPSCNLLLLPDAFLNRAVCQVGQRMINFLRWPVQLKKHILLNGLTPSARSRNTHPFFMMKTMAPSSRIRTTKPPAQAPRIRPMSSACWETSRALFESLQAAAQWRGSDTLPLDCRYTFNKTWTKAPKMS